MIHDFEPFNRVGWSVEEEDCLLVAGVQAALRHHDPYPWLSDRTAEAERARREELDR